MAEPTQIQLDMAVYENRLATMVQYPKRKVRREKVRANELEAQVVLY